MTRSHILGKLVRRRKTVIRRAWIWFCVGACCFAMGSGRAKPADSSLTLTRLFIGSWRPDLCSIQATADTPESELYDIATSVLHGNYSDVEERLGRLEDVARNQDDVPRMALVILWRQAITQRQYRFPCGGYTLTGASVAGSLKTQEIENQTVQEISALLQRLPPVAASDLNIAAVYGRAMDDMRLRTKTEGE